MNETLSLALLAGGIVLLIIGINATNSFGSPTDKSIWLIIGGVAATAVGLTMTLRRPKGA